MSPIKCDWSAQGRGRLQMGALGLKDEQGAVQVLQGRAGRPRVTHLQL